MGMSEPLNEAMLKLNPWICIDKPVYMLPEDGGYLLDRGTYLKYQYLFELVGYTAAKEHEEVREFLQLLGTEVGRKLIGEDVWVDMAARHAQERMDGGEDVIITGIRYPNEVSMIRRLGGALWWVERPGFSAPSDSTGAHDSENSVTWQDFDVVIRNDKTLPDLHVAVEDIL